MPTNKVAVTRAKLDNLANAIGSKSGEGIPLTLDQMVTAVDAMDILVPQTKTVTPSSTQQIITPDTEYGYTGLTQVTVAAVSGSSEPNLQTISNIDPTESSQTITADSGYDGISSIQINGISSSYVGSGIARKSSSDLTNSNLTVTAPAGYYASAATKTLTDANLVAGNIKNGTSIFGVTGTYETPHNYPTFTINFSSGTTISSVTCDITYAQCVNYITSNNLWYAVVHYGSGSIISGSLYRDNSVTNAPIYCYVETTTEGIATYKFTYASDGTITWEENPVELIDCPKFTLNNDGTTVTCNKTFAECEAFIDSSMAIGAIVDENSVISPIMVYELTENQIVYRIVYNAGEYGLLEVTLTYLSSGSITINQVMIEKKSSSDLTTSGATVTAPAGYYPAAATKTIASGSAATPATSITANPSITVGSDGLITATASATQSVTPTVSAGYVSSGTAGTITVSGSNTNQLSTQAGTTITPTESEQTAVAAGKYTTGTVKVGAISSTYVGSGIISRSVSDLSVLDEIVNVPAGYYSLSVAKAVATMTLPTSTTASATSGYTSKATINRSTSDQYINIAPGYNSAGGYYKISAVANGSATGPSSLSGSSATVTTGTNTITLTKTGVSTTPTVSAGYVSSATSSTATVALTASVTTKAAATITPGTTNQTIASGTYLTGTQTISGDSNLVASNIISGKTIFGVSGSVVIQHYYTGSSTPSSSTGVNGDIYLKTS